MKNHLLFQLPPLNEKDQLLRVVTCELLLSDVRYIEFNTNYNYIYYYIEFYKDCIYFLRYYM